MDEPLSNLDAKLRVQTRGEIKRLQKEIGTTTVYVTHDQVEAMTMGDRIAVMNHGRLEQVGTPEELYDHPANRFVAGFIGSPAMSFTPVVVEGGELRGDGFALPAGGAQGELVLGVRPEFVRPWRADAGLVGPVDGTVAYVEALGRETFLGVDTAGGERFVVCVDGRASEQPGDVMRFGLAPDGVRLFDAETAPRWPPRAPPLEQGHRAGLASRPASALCPGVPPGMTKCPPFSSPPEIKRG